MSRRGDKELSIPVTALPDLVNDSAKRNAGIPLPKKPIRNTAENLSRGIALKALIAKGTDATNEILSRRQASSTGVKAMRPFLIRI